MSESINPGFPPNRRNRLGDPARQVGDQHRTVAQMAARIASLERLLSSYRERQVQVRASDGEFQTITVLAKEGGSADNGGIGTTIEPRRIYKKAGVWRLVFYPAKFVEHSLKGAGTVHSIKLGSGTLDADPVEELALSGRTQDVWLQFSVTTESSVEEGSPAIVVGNSPEATPMQPKRPDGGDQQGVHVQHVGRITFTDGVPSWTPVNTSATVSVFITAIESVGDGERLFDTYQGDPPTDKWRSLRGQNDQELEEAGYPSRLEEEFIEGKDYPAFEVREVPTKIEVEIKDNTLTLKGFTKIVIPNGFSGQYRWKNCDDDSSTGGVKMNSDRGVVLNDNAAGGTYNACGCGECDDTSTVTPGP